MQIPIYNWSQEKVIWFVELLILAVKADNEITVTEMNFLVKYFAFVKDLNDKKRLLEALKSGGLKLQEPTNFGDSELAWIYTELVSVLISDFDFAEQERDFLAQVSEAFGFSNDYYHKIVIWCEEGLAWKYSKLALIESNEKSNKKEGEETEKLSNLAVPVNLMDQAQKFWYAQILVHTIVIDGVIDKEEMTLFKMVIGFVQDKQETMKLMTFLKYKEKPRLYHPNNLDETLKLRVFLEVINHFVTNSQNEEREKVFVNQLAGVCELSHESLKKGLEIWEDGILWHRAGERLIETAKIVRDCEVE